MIHLKKKRAGSAQFFVIAALVLISAFSALILRTLQQDIYQLHAEAMQMRAYYLADEAASAAVSALLADDDASLLMTGTFPMHDSMTHVSEGETVGVSVIDMVKETHPYYNEEEEWVVIRIKTTIPDTRADRQGEGFSYSITVMVLVDNPLVKLYNINPDDI